MPEINPLLKDTEVQFDDLQNTVGLGAPAIVRGKVSLKLANNVVQGAGQTTAIRQQNFTAINNAIALAASSGKWFEPEDGIYEFYGSTGIVIPITTAGFRWAGSKGVNLWQYNTNAPILQMGDLTGASQAYDQHIEGFTLNYGVSQTGFTGSNALEIGSMAWSTIREFNIGDTGIGNPANIALNISSSGTFFNNAFYDGYVYGGQTSIFVLGTSGTGNIFQNIYFCDGTNNNSNPAYCNTCTGPAFSLAQPSYGTLSDNIFSRINIESVLTSSFIIYLQEAYNTTLEAFHIENVSLTGADTCVLCNVGGTVEVIGMEIGDLRVTEPGCSIFTVSGSNDLVGVRGCNLSWTSAVTAGVEDTLYIVGIPAISDNDAQVTIENMRFIDTNWNNANMLVLDSNNTTPISTTIPSGYGSQMAQYRSDSALTETHGFCPTLSSSFTLYGCHNDAIIQIPADLTAAMTITLSNKRGATGFPSNLPTRTGNTVRFRRQGGTYANAVTIVDQASSSTIITLSAVSTNAMAMFNGTNWVSVAI